MYIKVTVIPQKKKDYKLVRFCVNESGPAKITTENSGLFKLFNKIFPISLIETSSQRFDCDERCRKISYYLINDFKDDYEAINNILDSEDILHQIEVNLMVREFLSGKSKNKNL